MWPVCKDGHGVLPRQRSALTLALTGTLLDIHPLPSVFSQAMRALLSESMQITQNEEKVALQPND
jgi:hypothetical protein